MLTRIASVLAVVVGLWGVYHFYFSPEAAYKREVQQALDGFSKTVETQNPDQIKAALTSLVSEFAHISLEVHFPMPGNAQKQPPAETFGKTEFIDFIGNIMYSVDHYHFKAKLGELVLDKDKESATIMFNAESNAHGTSGVMAEMGAQFTVPASCQAKLLFGAEAKPVISELTCTAQIQRGN